MHSYERFAHSDQTGGLLTRTVVVGDQTFSMLIKDVNGSRHDAFRKASHRIVEIKDQNYPQDELAMVFFAENAWVARPLGPVRGGLGDVGAAFASSSLGKSTNITSGLELAHKILAPIQQAGTPLLNKLSGLFFERDPRPASIRLVTDQRNERTRDQIVLLSDGGHNTGPDPGIAADRLKSLGVWISTVGIGNGVDFDEPLLKHLASRDQNGHPSYLHIHDTDSLVQHFENLAHHIRPMKGGR